MLERKAQVFWPLLLVLLLTDCSTKRLAEEHLLPAYVPREVLGDALRLTLAYNEGAATGITFGPLSRVAFSLAALVVVVVLLHQFRRAAAHDGWLAAALALVTGGAVGNLLDRLRSTRGVVDFIDIGVGEYRFWIFNVADVGVTVGAVLLAILLWRRDPARFEAPPSPSA